MEWITQAFVAAAIALLALAAWRDLTTRTIPDGISVALAALGLASRAASGWEAAAASLAAAAALFLILLFLHARHLLGGADVKLATALAIGLPPLAIWDFVVATALAGGLLSLLYLALPRVVPASLATQPGRSATAMRRVVAVEAWRMRRRSLPYGLAIAVGGTLVLLNMSGS